MPRKKHSRGKRVSIYLDGPALDVWELIENRSLFVQIALDQAAGIMAWAIMKKEHGYREPAATPKLQEILPEYNHTYPLDELTEKRLKQKNGTGIIRENPPAHYQPD